MSHVIASYTQKCQHLVPSKNVSNRQTDTHTAMYAHSATTQEKEDEEKEVCLLAEASSSQSLLSVNGSVMDSVAHTTTYHFLFQLANDAI